MKRFVRTRWIRPVILVLWILKGTLWIRLQISNEKPVEWLSFNKNDQHLTDARNLRGTKPILYHENFYCALAFLCAPIRKCTSIRKGNGRQGFVVKTSVQIRIKIKLTIQSGRAHTITIFNKNNIHVSRFLFLKTSQCSLCVLMYIECQSIQTLSK